VMDRRYAIITAQAVLSVIAVIALVWGSRFNWPDNVHVRHGFPLTWGTHTLVTIAGPVDIWKVDIVSLALDLFFWLGVMLAISLYLRRPSAGIV
jgi:hypothetical protein